MKKEQVASMIDHTFLKPIANYDSIKAICFEAIKYNFATVAIYTAFIPYAKKILDESNVGITAAIAFPFGNWNLEMKVFEVNDAINKGATDCDFVINIGALKDKKYDIVKKEMEAIRKAAKNLIVKAIIEVSLLNEDQIVKACELGIAAGLDYIKTSTGFYGKPTLNIANIMFDILKNTSTKLKVAGGMRTAEQAKIMVDAGARRLGTSNGVSIVKAWETT